MRILEYGEDYPKTVACEHCNSKLEYEGDDIFSHTDIYSDRTETFKYIKCPVCGESIDVDVRLVKLFEPQPKKKKWWEGWF